MIEPPGDAGGSAVLEINDGVFVAGKVRLLKERAGAVHQTMKIVLSILTNAFAVEAGE